MFTAAPLLADTRVRAVQMAGSPELAPWHSAGTHDQDMAVMNSNAIAGGTGRGCGAAGITGLRPGTHAPGPAGSQRCALGHASGDVAAGTRRTLIKPGHWPLRRVRTRQTAALRA